MVPENDAHGGFTLIEVLAAFFILATFLTATLAASVNAMEAYRIAASKRAALVVAQNRLDAIGVTEPAPALGTPSRGTDGVSFLWSVRTDAIRDDKTPYRGVWVTVAVFPVSGLGYDAQPLLQLRTLKLVRKPGHG